MRVRQRWLITGVRCDDGTARYAGGPEVEANGTMAYLSLPDVPGDFRGDVWLAEPSVTVVEDEPEPPVDDRLSLRLSRWLLGHYGTPEERERYR